MNIKKPSKKINPAHGRVTAHTPDGVDVHREHGGLDAKFPGGMGRLDTGVSTAYDNNVIFCDKGHKISRVCN